MKKLQKYDPILMKDWTYREVFEAVLPEEIAKKAIQNSKWPPDDTDKEASYGSCSHLAGCFLFTPYWAEINRKYFSG